MLKHFTDEIPRFQTLFQLADLTKWHPQFACVQALKKRLFTIVGQLTMARPIMLCNGSCRQRGVYCGPLQHLTIEVFDKGNELGAYCSLHIGQQKNHVLFANHVVWTVETTSTDEFSEVVIIETQMICKEVEGFAWGRSLLGLKVDKLHLCEALVVSCF